jgi:glycosyltransferase involved in cell wall biosynthesis
MMKIVLLMLSGDTTQARELISEQFPAAEIKTITRHDLEVGSYFRRLSALRKMRPDVFAIATESLAWQRGSHLLMTFGALAGAKEVVMLDAHGGHERSKRSQLLLRAPARVMYETGVAAAIVSRTRRHLRRIEQIMAANNWLLSDSTPLEPRVAYIRSTPGPGTQAGGASSHIKGVVEALVQLGASVKIFSNDPIAGLEKTNIPMVVLQSQSFGSTRAAFDIYSNKMFAKAAVPLIREFQPDIIYQRYARFSWVGVVATLLTRRPLFLEYNGSEVWVGKHWDHVGSLDLLARFERLNLAAAARIFVVSDVERRNLEAAGVSPAKIVVNPNGVDPSVFQPGVGGPAIREELGIGPDEVVAGFVGTFGPWHGVKVLAEAIKSIPGDVAVRYLMVGTGSLHAEVEQLLAAEGRKVIFTGAVPHGKVPALLDACDVLVAPHVPLDDGSEFFGSPTKLFEYMAMGKAIVASQLGQIGEILEHENTALLVSPGDVSELAAAIIRLAGSAELRERLGVKAREEAVSKHTWRHNAERVLSAYRSLEEV